MASARSESGPPRLLVLACLVDDDRYEALMEGLYDAAHGVACKDTGGIATYDLSERRNLGITAELRSLDLSETADAIEALARRGQTGEEPQHG